MKEKPPAPPKVLTAAEWRRAPKELAALYKGKFLKALVALEDDWSKRVARTEFQAANVKATASDEIRTAMEEAAYAWDELCTCVQDHCDNISDIAKKELAEQVEKLDPAAKKKLDTLVAECEKFKKKYSGKFDTKDFEALLGKTDPPVFQAAFLKAAGTLSKTCDEGAKKATTLFKEAEAVRSLLDKHIREARGHERTLKGAIPVGGGKLAKAFAKRHYGKTQNELAKKERIIAKESDALAKLADQIADLMGELEKAANGNATIGKKIEKADKHVYLIGCGSDIYEQFARDIHPLPDQLKNGQSLTGLKLKKIPGNKITAEFKRLSRWSKTMQKVV